MQSKNFYLILILREKLCDQERNGVWKDIGLFIAYPCSFVRGK
jgi:hypothetical protein